MSTAISGFPNDLGKEGRYTHKLDPFLNKKSFSHQIPVWFAQKKCWQNCDRTIFNDSWHFPVKYHFFSSLDRKVRDAQIRRQCASEISDLKIEQRTPHGWLLDCRPHCIFIPLNPCFSPIENKFYYLRGKNREIGRIEELRGKNHWMSVIFEPW